MCTLDITKVGTLGGPGDSVLLTTETMITVRSDGRFIVAPTSRSGEAALYDSLNGVGRSYGRRGEGPGENGRILNVLPWPGDSVLVVGFGRFTILGGDRGAGRTIRLERTSASDRTVALPADGVIVRNYTYPPDREFVVFNVDGSIRTEMGYTWNSGFRGDIYQALGELGPAQRPHSFWSAPLRYRHVAELWDARTGASLRTLALNTPWYTPYDSASFYRFMLSGGDEASAPPPFVVGVREAVDSVLWLVYDTPARNWSGRSDTMPPDRRRPRREAYDAVIELVDPVSGDELLSTWVNLPLARLVNDSLLADQRQTSDGFWVYDIYKAKLRRH